MRNWKEYLIETLFRSGLYYHGSNKDDIVYFELKDESKDNFRLLGDGIYFVKNKKEASKYGKYIYISNINKKDFRILDDKYKITKSNIEGLLTNLGVDVSKVQSVLGMENILWWFVDAYKYLNLNRSFVVNKVKRFFEIIYSFDGISVKYPSMGDVLVIWNQDKFKIASPIDVIIK